MSKAKGMVETRVTIAPPKFTVGIWTIRGIAPLVINKFSQKAKEKIKGTQEAGSVAKKGKKREPKDFQMCYEEAKHICSPKTGNPWCGIPANGLRAGMVSACRLCGFKMTWAKLSFFVLADGYDDDDGTPLVRITQGEPHISITPARNDNGSVDLRARPMWEPGWEAEVRVRFDADQFTLEDITNLLMRVGMQVGTCEGRPDSRDSCGVGWGLFEIVQNNEVRS